MARPGTTAVTLATALLFWPLCLNGQRASELLADALTQVRAHRLDSAITLLHTITSSGQADSSERAEAFLWLSGATFYKGQASAAGGSFRNGLAIVPFLMPAGGLFSLDSRLPCLWTY